MNQVPLNHYFLSKFACDRCGNEYHNQTAYSLAPNLDKINSYHTYCSNCAVEEEPQPCSFFTRDEQGNRITCDKPLFDKKKALCRSHNSQVRKRFREFLKGKSIGSDVAWEMTWEQSEDWRYFWNLGEEKEQNDKKSLPETKNEDWGKIKKKSLGEIPHEASGNLNAPELAPRDGRISGRTRQLNLKVKEETYWLLKEMALQEKRLMTEILERALESYQKQQKT